jgi:hypothetical protein
MAKKHDLRGKKKIRLSHAVAVERKICVTPVASTIRPRNLKFWLPASFGPTCPGCPAYSEFRTSGS